MIPKQYFLVYFVKSLQTGTKHELHYKIQVHHIPFRQHINIKTNITRHANDWISIVKLNVL